MRTLIVDLHGVLVDSRRVKENYEIFLIKLFANLNINKQKAVEYHEKGLNYFLKSVKMISSKNFIDEQFLEEMKIIDDRWDNLMTEPVDNNKNKLIIQQIESRFIEEEAGRVRNVLYPDAEDFINYWFKNLQYKFRLIIASNSHHSHIKGVIRGLNEEIAKNVIIYGWDTSKCFKSHPHYFTRLKRYIVNNLESENPLIMIGNSDNEIIGSLREKMIPILINRDSKLADITFKLALKTFGSLEGVWDFIKELN